MKIPLGAMIFVTVVTAAWMQAVGQQVSTQGKVTETLTIWKLLANAQSYVGQMVRLKVTLVANFEFSALTDASCQPSPAEVDGTHPLIAPSFDVTSYRPKSPLAKKLTKLLKRKYQARVTLIGVFVDPGAYFGHQLCCRYRLDVSNLVSVEEVTADIGAADQLISWRQIAIALIDGSFGFANMDIRPKRSFTPSCWLQR